MGDEGTGAVAELDYLDVVFGADLSALQHDAENALVGKDAVAGEIVDGTAGVADFADLADFDQHVTANFELRAKGERQQVDALGRKVFAKVALVYIEAARLGCLDRFCSQKRDLAVPMPRVSIGSKAKLRDGGIMPIDDGCLARPLMR